MSNAYDRETQIEDLAAIDAAQAILSAKVAGEQPNVLKPQMDVFARIAGYYLPNHGQVKRVARCFWSITTHNKISGLECNTFATLLPEVRRMVRAKLICRKKVTKTCLQPDIHVQKCYCGHLVNAKALEDK